MTEPAQSQDGGSQAESAPAVVSAAEVAAAEVPAAEAPGPVPSSPFPAPLAGVAAALPTDRPEVTIGGAFAGGLVLGLILKRLAR